MVGEELRVAKGCRDGLSYLKFQFVAAVPSLNEMFEKQIICSSFESLTEKFPVQSINGTVLPEQICVEVTVYS
jgi:hypothetical protein